jgi:hypothetical protein
MENFNWMQRLGHAGYYFGRADNYAAHFYASLGSHQSFCHRGPFPDTLHPGSLVVSGAGDVAFTGPTCQPYRAQTRWPFAGPLPACAPDAHLTPTDRLPTTAFSAPAKPKNTDQRVRLTFLLLPATSSPSPSLLALQNHP